MHVLDAADSIGWRWRSRRQAPGINAVAEEGVPVRDIAEAIGRGLKVPVVSKSPEEAAAHFGLLAMFMSRDLIGSSVQTQRRLAWRPTGPGLIADLERGSYFETAHAARSSVSGSPINRQWDSWDATYCPRPSQW